VKVDIEGEDLIVAGDAELLKPVFLNLLVNAGQAAGSAGKISISVGNTGGLCRVAVQDNGPGIPVEIREKIFEPFFSTKHRGTGLGLPIARRIVEAHGGTITLACPREGGTTVAVELPLRERRDEGTQ
jgi:signal transduction histidine kinase